MTISVKYYLGIIVYSKNKHLVTDHVIDLWVDVKVIAGPLQTRGIEPMLL